MNMLELIPKLLNLEFKDCQSFKELENLKKFND